MQAGRSVKQTLFAIILTMVVFFVATGFARSHAMESEAIGGFLLWLASGAVAIWMALLFCRGAMPRHSRGWTAFAVTLILVALTYRSGKVAGWGFALFAYGSGLLPAIIASWQALPRETAAEPAQPV